VASVTIVNTHRVPAIAVFIRTRVQTARTFQEMFVDISFGKNLAQNVTVGTVKMFAQCFCFPSTLRTFHRNFGL